MYRVSSKRWSAVTLTASLALSLLCAQPAQAEHGEPKLKPVAVISDTFLPITTAQGTAELPLYLSAPWDTAQPQVVRAVLVVHGKLRNADTYFKIGLKARTAAGAEPSTTLMIAPQFLATVDTDVHHEPDDVLRWDGNAWMGGEPAQGSVPLSSFAALDAIVQRLADRRLFPNLQEIVIAGHSGGGQVVQRYAVAMRDQPALAAEHIALRFLVANPSSYAYFDALRPDGGGKLAPFDGARCADFDDWKYGMQQRPPYLSGRTPTELKNAYAARRVQYLVGGDDVDPQQAALDKTCAAEAQGPQRLARGEAYFHYLQARHPGTLQQSFGIVPGVGHSGSGMLTSACAQSVMFGNGSCQKQSSEP